jgi:hypothetical protein
MAKLDKSDMLENIFYLQDDAIMKMWPARKDRARVL